MGNNNQSYATGISLPTMLGVAFIVLKLCNVIAWPWLWVLAPIWIPVAFALGVMAIAFVFIVLRAVLS